MLDKNKDFPEKNNRLPDNLHGRSLDTKEQVRNSTSTSKPKSVKTLDNKAYKFAVKSALLSQLIDYAEISNSPNLNSYWNAFNCGRVLVQSENKFIKQETYCGSRLCSICSNIRSQKLADLYFPLVDRTKKYAFLTLTDSNNDIEFSTEKLKLKLKKQAIFFTRIKDRLRKRGVENIDAIICLEIVPPTYKKHTKSGKFYYADFHPHYHCFVPYELAVLIKEIWLEFNPDASEVNQKIKSVDVSTEQAIRKSFREIIKYSIKATVPNEFDGKKGKVVNLKGVDEIFTLLKGTRRLKTWGIFYDVKHIETADMRDFNLEKQEYTDVPVMDTGKVILSHDWLGREIDEIPEFVREVKYVFCNKHNNYFYKDDYGNEVQLTFFSYSEKHKKPKFKFYVDRKTFKEFKDKLKE